MLGDVKEKIMRFLKINTTEDYSKATGVSNVHGGGKKPIKTKIKKNLKTS